MQALDPIIDKLPFLHLQAFDHMEPLQKIASKIGMGAKPHHLVFISSIVVIGLLALNIAATFLSQFIGFIYPAYMSIKALESKGEDDDKQWLTYWVVFSLFQFIEGVLGFISVLIPFYFLLKLAFYVYLFHPKTQGATNLYLKFVQPYVRQYSQQIDKMGEEYAKKVKQGLQSAEENLSKQN